MKKPKIGGRSNVRSRKSKTQKAPFEVVGWVWTEAVKGNIVNMKKAVCTPHSLIYKISTKKDLNTRNYLNSLDLNSVTLVGSEVVDSGNMVIQEVHNEPYDRKDFLGIAYEN